MKKRGIIRPGLLLFPALFVLFSNSPMRGLAWGEEEWVAPPRKAAIRNPMPRDEKSLALGRKVYESECLPCHGPKGEGDGPKAHELEKKVASLLGKKFSFQSDGALFWKIGIGNKPMPSYKKLLSDEERWSVVNYLRRLCQTSSW